MNFRFHIPFNCIQSIEFSFRRRVVNHNQLIHRSHFKTLNNNDSNNSNNKKTSNHKHQQHRKFHHDVHERVIVLIYRSATAGKSRCGFIFIDFKTYRHICFKAIVTFWRHIILSLVFYMGCKVIAISNITNHSFQMQPHITECAWVTIVIVVLNEIPTRSLKWVSFILKRREKKTRENLSKKQYGAKGKLMNLSCMPLNQFYGH